MSSHLSLPTKLCELLSHSWTGSEPASLLLCVLLSKNPFTVPWAAVWSLAMSLFQFNACFTWVSLGRKCQSPSHSLCLRHPLSFIQIPIRIILLLTIHLYCQLDRIWNQLETHLRLDCGDISKRSFLHGSDTIPWLDTEKAMSTTINLTLLPDFRYQETSHFLLRSPCLPSLDWLYPQSLNLNNSLLL